MSDLEDVLNERHRAGRLDSHGRFAVDFERALELLGRCRLPTPYHFQHKLVQAAVAGGATQVVVSSSGEGLEVRLEGLHVPQELVGSLLSFGLEFTSERYLSHLATAVHAATRLGSRRLVLEVWDGRVASVLTWSKDQAELRGDQPCAFPQPGLALRVTRGFFTDIFAAGAAAWHRSTLFDYAPLPIIEEGKPVNRLPGSPGPSQAKAPSQLTLSAPTTWQKFLVAEKSEAGLIAGPAQPLDMHRSHVLVSGLGDPSPRPWTPGQGAVSPRLQVDGAPAVGCLAQFYGTWGGHQIRWLVDGVVLEETWQSAGNSAPPYTALVSANSLRTDLSGFKLVRDEAFEEASRWLHAQAG